MNPWIRTHKGDVRARELADRHYTRQRPGHPMWTRPGYNYVLLAEDAKGRAVFCWWRPKWEAGQERFDGLRVLECTIFRNETAWRSSDLIRAAVEALDAPMARSDLAGEVAPSDGLITGVGAEKTSGGRSPWHKPGHCFKKAGWVEFEHKKGRADVWLRLHNDRETSSKDKEALMAEPKLTREVNSLLNSDGFLIEREELPNGRVRIVVEVDRYAIIQAGLPLLLERAKAGENGAQKPRKKMKKKGGQRPDAETTPPPLDAKKGAPVAPLGASLDHGPVTK